MRRRGSVLATRYMNMHLWPDIEPSCRNMAKCTTGIESGGYEKLVNELAQYCIPTFLYGLGGANDGKQI
eukprot:COSAG02_NODE_4736_length_5038_cov_1.583519_2_plen_69_part_00